ncbi:MAG: ubiquitin-like protein Pup [Candidatus Aenigmarchaeota archaeon]|nr:ubiquitin-like protein Pup [Candidatus Aenigmarchaeota archaeon]
MRSYRRSVLEIGELIPLSVYGVSTSRVVNEQKRQTGYSGQTTSKGSYELEKEVKLDAEVDTDTSEYDEILDEIDELIADEEQAEQYVQLGGQ